MSAARLMRRWAAVACLFAVLAVFTLEGIPHRHASSADRSCPACQAARQHVGDAPRAAGGFLAAPASPRPQLPEPAIERIAGSQPVSSASPRSPPPANA